MIRGLFLFLTTIIFLSCSNNKKEIIGNWVLGSSFHLDPEEIHSYEKQIYKFSENKVTVNYLSTGATYSRHKTKVSNYRIINNNEIELNLYEKLDTMHLNYLSSDSLVLEKNGYYLTFGKLKKRNEQQSKESLLNKLKKSIYSFEFHDDPMEVEFLNDSVYITNSVSNDFTIPLFFNITEYENDLFLVFHSSMGPSLKFLKFDNDDIIFKLYGGGNPEIRFVKLNKVTKYKPLQLIGKWKENLKALDEKNNIIPETLEITDSTIVKEGYFKPEESNWSLNKSGEIILFTKSWRGERKFQWNIIDLNSNSLVLEKRLKNATVKRIEYKKVN